LLSIADARELIREYVKKEVGIPSFNIIFNKYSESDIRQKS